jgi:hypothetical protein
MMPRMKLLECAEIRRGRDGGVPVGPKKSRRQAADPFTENPRAGPYLRGMLIDRLPDRRKDRAVLDRSTGICCP